MNSNKQDVNDSSIVFFIDKAQFKTETPKLTAGNLLSQYAQEDPAETTLVLKHGNDLTKYENDSQLITLENGMHFIVFHDGPTTVSNYGPQRLVSELSSLGYTPELTNDGGSNPFTVIRGYEVQLGRFAGRVIDLALPMTADFPISVGASIHVRANPQLIEKGSIPDVRNIIDSTLGSEWCYWSRNFNWSQQTQKTARRLMAQIAGVFKDA